MPVRFVNDEIRYDRQRQKYESPVMTTYDSKLNPN